MTTDAAITARRDRASRTFWVGCALRMRASDDGTGGARVEADGGLAGLAALVKAVDGRLQISSPSGGPA